MRALLVALTLLASIGFYNYHDMVSAQMCVILLCFFILLTGAYAFQFPQPIAPEIHFPVIPWILILAGIVISMFMAFLVHGQEMIHNLTATGSYFFDFLFLYILLKLNPEPKRLFLYFFIITGVSILVYFVNFKTFPNVIFGASLREDLTRGILRLPIPLFQLLLLLFFYSINKFSIERKKKWLIFIGIGVAMIFLSVIRQVIAIAIPLGILLYTQKYVWYKRVLAIVAVAAVSIVIFTHLPMYKTMVELSQWQYENSAVNEKEDVRVGAWRYYALEAQQENPVTAIFGNGAYALEKSAWGKDLKNMMEDNGYLSADISLAGFYFRFGLLATIPLLYILIQAIIKRKSPQKRYLSYFIACITLESIASGVMEYHYELLVLIIALYLVYRSDEAPQELSDHEPPQTMKQSFINFITR